MQQRNPHVFRQPAAGFDLILRNHVHYGEFHLGNLFLRFSGKFQHRLKGTVKIRKAELVIGFAVRRVQTDGDTVDVPGQKRDNIFFVDQVSQSVCIEPQFYMGIQSFHIRGRFKKQIQGAGGLSVSAEYQFLILSEIKLVDGCFHLGPVRVLLMPQSPGAAQPVAGIADAEGAVARHNGADAEFHSHGDENDQHGHGQHDGAHQHGRRGKGAPQAAAGDEEHGNEGDEGGQAAVAGHEGVGENGDEPLPGALDDPAPHDAAGVAS